MKHFTSQFGANVSSNFFDTNAYVTLGEWWTLAPRCCISKRFATTQCNTSRTHQITQKHQIQIL